MHQVIAARMGIAGKVDHVRNTEPLNNCRSNLRAATASQNAVNRDKQSNNTSDFKGVSPHRGKWQATITVNGRNTYLGLFPGTATGKIEAAIAYNKAALEHFVGEFAYQNPIPLGEH
jgi:hypothetical protein